LVACGQIAYFKNGNGSLISIFLAETVGFEVSQNNDLALVSLISADISAKPWRRNHIKPRV
jgi:hypothetical protein